MEIDKSKLSSLLDLLRIKLIQQRTLTDDITKLYEEINVLSGNLITVETTSKVKNGKAWGPDPSFVPPVTPESQYLKSHTLSKEF